MRTWLCAIRVHQWTKNLVIPAAWFFAVNDPTQGTMSLGWRPFLLMLGMFGSFCLVSSAFYLLNDIVDVNKDRLHPTKRLRPIAAGIISETKAKYVAGVLWGFGVIPPIIIFLRHWDRWLALAVVGVYSLIQLGYSRYGLKRIPYIDAILIAFGFGLRAAAGTTALCIRLSPWMLASVTALSMFLAFCKRRHEKMLWDTGVGAFRAALDGYNRRVLDVLVAVMALFTLVIYVAYTLDSTTVARFRGGEQLVWTALPVALGLVRYLWLTYSHEDVGRPERILLTDRIIWLSLFLYGCSVVAVLGFNWGL